MFIKRLFEKHIAFEIHNPNILITKSMTKNFVVLRENNIEYDIVKDGYLCFRANVFSDDCVLKVGLHYSCDHLQYIELFRPKEYYTEDYNIDVSFEDLNNQITSRYGKPTFKLIIPTTDAYAGSKTKWLLNGIKIDHWIMERFGLEEHLNIYLNLLYDPHI